MLIKSADDPARRLQLLEALLTSPRIDFSQKERLRKYLKRIKIGIQGERDAAHYIDTHLRAGENHAVIHDLRFEVRGEIAQIDHLIISRGFFFYLLETKNFGGDLIINEHGEFTVKYGEDRYGIESPIEQSKRHEAMFLLLLDELGITGRFSKRPPIFHAVLLHPRALIERPSASVFDTSCVMKADQFESWRLETVNSFGVVKILSLATNIVSTDTLSEWAKKIAARHTPENYLNLPGWLEPKRVDAPTPARNTAPTTSQLNYPARGAPKISKPHAETRKLVCSTCGAKISFAEGKFCWNNSKRFGGQQYCREHQSAF